MIYLDTSALVKLILQETETPALLDWLAENSQKPRVTSALSRVELMRAAARDGRPETTERARLLLAGIDQIAISEHLLDVAESIGPPSLRSLDAIHLASAAEVPLTALVGYDQRLLYGAVSLGLPVSSPA